MGGYKTVVPYLMLIFIVNTAAVSVKLPPSQDQSLCSHPLCYEEENIVFVVENNKCFVYRNEYQLALENCRRRQAGEKRK